MNGFRAYDILLGGLRQTPAPLWVSASYLGSEMTDSLFPPRNFYIVLLLNIVKTSYNNDIYSRKLENAEENLDDS